MANLPSLIVPVGANIAGFTNAMGTMSQQLSKLDRDAAKAFAGFDKIGDRLTSLGGSLAASITAPLGLASMAAIKTAGDFELSMNKIKAFGDISGASLEKLREQALKLGADTQFSAQQAADAMVVFASAGLKTEQIYAAMPGTLNLAAAGQIAVGDAATITKDILGQFGLAAKDSGHVADVLAQASADASASLSEMATTLTYAGPVAKGAGQSLEETVAAIVALDAAGIRAEKAGTGLRGVLGSLLAPSKEAAGFIEQLGIKISDVNGNIRPLSDIMEQFKQSLAKVGGEAEKQRIIFEIFGREAGTAAQVLINTGGAALDNWEQKLVRSSEQMGVFNGAADKMAKTINSGVNFSLDQFKGSVETAAIALGTALLPTVNAALTLLTGFVNDAVIPAVKWFSQLSEPVKNTAIGLGAFAIAIGPVIAGLGLLVSAASSVGAGLTTIAALFTALGATSVPAASAALATFATVTVPAAISAVATFATVTLPAAILQVGFLSEIMLRQAVTSVATFATVTIPAAIASVGTFATTAIPGAIASVTTFATVTIPAAISALVTFTTVTIPAAVSGLVSFATAGVGSAVTSLGTMASSAIPAVIGILSTLGVAATLAAGVFVGWKLGQWAYEQIPGMKALGDSIADIALSIPLVEPALLRLTGASKAQAKASEDLDFATQKLEASLKSKGVTVDRTGKTTEQYAAALREAAKGAGQATPATDAASKAMASFAQVTETAAKMFDRLKTAATAADVQFKSTLKAYQEGKTTLDAVTAAQIALNKAQDAADPERLAKRQAQALDDMNKRYDDLGKEVKQLETELLKLDPIARAAISPSATSSLVEYRDRLKEMVEAAKSAKELEHLREELKKTDAALQHSATQLENTFIRALGEMHKEALKPIKITTPIFDERMFGMLKDLGAEELAGSFMRVTPAIQAAIDKTKQFGDDLKTLGISHDRHADAAIAAYERIKESGRATSHEGLLAERNMLDTVIKERMAAGEKIAQADRDRLDKLNKQLDPKKISEFMRQVSTIITDMSRNIAGGIFDLFKPSKKNKQLDDQRAELQRSLVEREADWEKYQAEVARKMEDLTAKNAEELAKQEDEVRKSLAAKQADYERDIAAIQQKITDLHERTARSIADDTDKVMEGQREQEEAYAEFAQGVEEKLAELPGKYQEQLDKELQSLQSSLRDRAQEYERFVEDTNTRLSRIGEDLTERIDDQTKSNTRGTETENKDFERDVQDINKRIADENRDFSRDVQDINKEIAEAGKKGDKKRTAELREQLARRTEDHRLALERQAEQIRRREEDHRASLKRMKEDLDESVDDARKDAERQTTDLQEQLRERTEDYEKFLKENKEREEKARASAATGLANETADLEKSLRDRADQLIAYRAEVKRRIEKITEDHLAEQAIQERNLRDSMAERTSEWEGYKRDANDKLIELRGLAEGNLREQKDDLIASLNEHRTEWDKYKTDVNTKLNELARDYETWTGRLKDAMASALGDMGEAIARFGLESLTKGLFKWIGDLVGDLIPSIGTALGKVFGPVFGGATSAAGSAASGAASAGSAAAGAAGGGLASVLSAIGSIGSFATGIIGIFQQGRQENTLNAIEESTRFTAIATIGPAGIISTLREFLPPLKDWINTGWYGGFMGAGGAFGQLMTTVEEIRDIMKMPQPAMAMGANISITVNGNIISERELADVIGERLEQRWREANQI